MQTTLFGAPAATNGFRNSSFSKNKNLPLHRWVPWIAGFSADFVEDAIRSYLPQKNSDSWVLDPFAGVGTTLVESYLTGLNVVGFEINPYAFELAHKNSRRYENDGATPWTYREVED